MTVVTMRIEPVDLCGLDAQLWALGPVRLLRDDVGISLECDDEAAVPAAVRALARAGARVVAQEEGPERSRPVGVAALARHLEPIRVARIVDTVSIRPLPPGAASARLVRRGLLGRRRADVEAIRGVLRGCERVFLWRRVVWAEPRVARSRALAALRPVVFDRAALERPEDTLAFVSADALTRWAR